MIDQNFRDSLIKKLGAVGDFWDEETRSFNIFDSRGVIVAAIFDRGIEWRIEILSRLIKNS